MAEIILDSPKYGKITAPDVIKSEGIGVCLVAGAVYGDNGYMLHTHSFDSNMPPVREFFRALRRDIPESERDKAYVFLAGGSPDDGKTDRKLLEERILAEGYSIKHTRWNRPNTLQSLTLNLGKREAIYSEEEYDDMYSPNARLIKPDRKTFRF